MTIPLLTPYLTYEVRERLPRAVRIDGPVPLHDFMAFSKLMGFEDIWEFDRRHAEA